MKKGIRMALTLATLACLAVGVYFLIISIKGECRSYALSAALGLTALGNFINLIAIKQRDK